MPMWRNIAGTWRTGTLWRNIGGTWKSGIMWRNIGGVWKPVGGNALVVGHQPSAAFGFTTNPGGTVGYAIGSFTPASIIFPSGASYTVTDCIWFGSGNVSFRVAAALPNSGWTTLRINGSTFSRASASYSAGVPGGHTGWLWSSGNPFTAEGTYSSVSVV